MGDRAIVTFTDGDGHYSPGIYLHWNGSDVEEFLKAALWDMTQGDQEYSAARFCGYCHTQLPGTLSLGLVDKPNPPADATRSWWTEKYGPGDNGVFIVNVCDWWVIQHRFRNTRCFQLEADGEPERRLKRALLGEGEAL